MSATREARVVVIGAGVGGLGVAQALIQRLADPEAVVVLEGSPRPGGLIQSVAAEGYRVEWAANGFLDNAPLTLDLVHALGLDAELQPASAEARHRFLWRGGRLHPLATSPLGFMRSSVLSLGGRLRVALEPFARPAPPGDESVHAFAARRIGPEAARILVDAMVSGIFAGDSNKLSLASSFPLLKQLETGHGSLVRGMLARMREARHAPAAGGPKAEVEAGPSGTLTSFRQGMETLTHALASRVPQLEVATPVKSIAARSSGGLRVVTLMGETIETPVVVVATPPHAASALLADLDREVAAELAAIREAPLAVVATGYRAADLPAPLAGFGFLVPRGEGLRMLGCLWDSSIFPGRAPEGRVLMRTMIGGAHDPEAATLDPGELLAITRRELGTVLGIQAEPDFVRVIRHAHGIPQYEIGHGERLQRIDARLALHPGLHLAGFGYRGVAVNRVLEDAAALAERLVRTLSDDAAGAQRTITSFR